MHGSGLLDPTAPGGMPGQQGMPLFNAADLLDPQVLRGIPLAEPEPGGGATNLAAPAAPGSAGISQPPPMINAADLFDPALLAELTQGSDRGERAAGDKGQPEGWLLDGARQEGPPPDFNNGQRPIRQATGPITPLFSLPPLTAPTTPPYSPPPARPQPPQPNGPAFIPSLPGEPEEMAPPSDRGWRVVSPGPPLGRLRSGSAPRPQSGYPPVPYPEMSVPPPAPPRRQQQADGPSGLTRALGGWLSLLLVLSIIGIAVVFAGIHYFQAENAQTNAGGSSGSLPTVAPKAGYTIYRDASLGFSLQYPSTWQEQSDTDQNDPQYKGDLFRISSDAALEVGSSPQYQNWSAAQIDDNVLNDLPGFMNVSSVNPTVSTASTILIAGLQWTPEQATVTLTSGLTLTMMTLATSYNGRGYVIFYFSNPQVFDNYNSQYFDKVLLSFRILG